jgi:GTPase
MMKPVVALVGRPNVGKSTFFNRLVGERLAIVDDTPGTTRDRILADADWNGVTFTVIDTGGLDPTHGGKTPLSIGSADFIDEIRSQAQVAIEDADVVVLMCDGETGVTAADKEVADLLRRAQRKVDGKRRPPIFVAVNKCESASRRAQAAEFYELGLGRPYAISAIHGTDTGDLLDEIVKAFPPQRSRRKTMIGQNCDCRQAQRRQIIPAQPPARQGARHCQPDCRNDPRRHRFAARFTRAFPLP